MQDFLRNEWKTIFIVTIFCAAIYSWFYVQDSKKKAEANSPYAYTCFRPGAALGQFVLGTPKSDVDLSAFAMNPAASGDFGVESWASAKGDITLNFRHEKLASIEFFPSRYGGDIDACKRDIEEFKKKNSPIAQPIPVENRTNVMFAGAVYVSRQDAQKGKPDGGDSAHADGREFDVERSQGGENSENSSDGRAKFASTPAHDVQPDSWLIIRSR